MYPSAMGFFYYHGEGNRVFVTVNAVEAFSKADGSTFEEVVRSLSDLKPGGETAFDSLRAGYLSPGDLLYVPPAQLCFERAVNGTNVGFRVLSSIATNTCKDDMDMVMSIYPQKLVFFWQA